MNPYKIILADDHVMFRQGVKKIIDESKEVVVIGEAADGAELLEILSERTPDMVVADISMPNIDGVEATRKIKHHYPQVKILILSMHKEKEYLYQALSAGADGYLLKEDTASDIFSATETIRKGSCYLSPLFSSEVAEDLMAYYRGDSLLASDALTNREREVLKLVAEGKSSKEIADILYISPRTVQHHRENITKKLNAVSIADLVKYAIRKGYVSRMS